MWSIERPALLCLLLLVPLIAWFTYFRRGRGGTVPLSHSAWKDAQLKVPASLFAVLHAISVVFSLSGFTLLIVALSGPAIVEKEKVFLTKGIDLVIALDQSPSMSAPDFQPTNRFECAKAVIKKFIESRENDQIGLVTFGSEAALRVPPTFDYAFLTQTLRSLEIMELGEGTAIGMGIAVATLHLSAGESRQKVIILLTDGVNNEGAISPLDAATSAMKLGIRIYTIGIGKESESEWTFKDPKTGKPYLARSGQFDDTTLKSVSAITGGSYFYAGEPHILKNVFSEIDSMETTRKRVKTIARIREEHEPFIVLGLALICISFILRKTMLREII